MLGWLKRKFADIQAGNTEQPVPEPVSTTEASLLQNNRWYSYLPDADTVIVFVHGLLSNSEQCWTNPNGNSWPQLVRDDQTFRGNAIYLGGYYTALDSRDYDIPHCADELFRSMELRGTSRRSPLSFQNICFICHSLGGIVVRRMLEHQAEAFRDKQLGMVLMASPSLGADYGRVLTAVARLYKHKVGLNLKHGSDTLRDIDNRFRDLLQRRRPLILGVEAVEHHPLFSTGFLPSSRKPVVTADSASRYFGGERMIPGTNHITVAKPDTIEHDSHRFLVHFFQTQYLPATELAQTGPLSLVKNDGRYRISAEALALFDVYEPQCAPYYLQRKADDDFARKINLCSLWVTGPSASGKTSLVRRHLRENDKKTIEVTLSHCGTELTEDYCLAEILDSASPERFEGTKSGKRTFAELVDVLSRQATDVDVVLFLDEIPIHRDSAGNRMFIRFAADLLDSVAKRGGAHVRFVFCSIEKPLIDSTHAKFLGQLAFVHLDPWSDTEIRDLISLIQTDLPTLTLSPKIVDDLVSTSGGSPRFVKHYLKQVLLSETRNLESDELMLSRSVEHFMMGL